MLGLLLTLTGASRKDVYMNVETGEKQSELFSDLRALDRHKQAPLFANNEFMAVNVDLKIPN